MFYEDIEYSKKIFIKNIIKLKKDIDKKKNVWYYRLSIKNKEEIKMKATKIQKVFDRYGNTIGEKEIKKDNIEVKEIEKYISLEEIEVLHEMKNFYFYIPISLEYEWKIDIDENYDELKSLF